MSDQEPPQQPEEPKPEGWQPREWEPKWQPQYEPDPEHPGEPTQPLGNPYTTPQQPSEPTQPYTQPQQPYQQPGQPPPYTGWTQPQPGQWHPGQQAGQPGPQQYPQGSYPAYGMAPNDPGAQTSMVVGLVSLVLGFFCAFGFLGSPFAMVMGQRSKRRIDASGGALGGRGNAQAGFVLGLVGTILLVLGVVAIVVLIVLLIAFGTSDTYSDTYGTNL